MDADTRDLFRTDVFPDVKVRGLFGSTMTAWSSPPSPQTNACWTTCSPIRRSRTFYIGDHPTYWMEPGIPHDSYLGEFLMRTKAVIRD